MLVTCAHFYEPVEAHVVRARLEAEGIPATVADDLLVTANWPLTVALGGTRLQVPAEFLAEAKAIVAAYYSGELAADLDAETGDEPEKCPRCQSRSVKRSVPASQKMLALGVFALTAVTFPTRDLLRLCGDCGQEWRGAA